MKRRILTFLTIMFLGVMMSGCMVVQPSHSYPVAYERPVVVIQNPQPVATQPLIREEVIVRPQRSYYPPKRYYQPYPYYRYRGR